MTRRPVLIFCCAIFSTAALHGMLFGAGARADQPDAPNPPPPIAAPAAETRAPALIGAAAVDITPDYPVRLTGYGNRQRESDGIAARIHARALVIEPTAVAVGLATDSAELGSGPGTSLLPTSGSKTPGADAARLAILITVDNCGVPLEMTESVFARIVAKYAVTRERFVISSTHSHSAPWLRGFAPNIIAEIPDDHAARLAKYESELTDKLVEVVDKAIQSRRPGHLSVGFGQTDFAMNRRTLQNGKWTGFGEVPDGPTDQRVPVMAAHDAQGKLIAVLANYACHCTTETGEFNQISGDWAGFAADQLETDYPGAVALIAIGCGADANPSPRGTHDQAKLHGRTMASEVSRLLNAVPRPQEQSAPDTELPPLRPISHQLACNLTRIDLPLGPLPSRATWEAKSTQPGTVGAHARYFLKMLDDGKPIPTTIPDYPVQIWSFGEDLAMVFLGGEVVVDYSLRLNDMFDGNRLWINAYSNDVPCYIASARVLREGGYECDSSMIYYRRPTRLAPEAEDLICDTVQKLMPHAFYSAELQRDFPGPKSPNESLKCITTKPDLEVVLAASEPLIRDPVAFDWDEQGRLWVVEMGDYPSGGGSRIEDRGSRESQDTAIDAAQSATSQSSILYPRSSSGRVRVLEDTNSDGVYDKATTFLEGLAFPSGIHCWRDGAIITMAPEIFFARDTSGDGRADERHTLFRGFTEGNQQHRVNGLRWGLDGWLYLANGDSGGEISGTGYRLANGAGVRTRTDDSGVGKNPGADAARLAEGSAKGVTERIPIRGRDLRIDPDLNRIDAASGQTQFGRERDDFGNWFGNNNSNPIWQYVLEDRYVRRNPHAGISQVTAQVSAVPGAAPVYPTSHTLTRFNDFGFANRFTSACGTMIYRDRALGEQYYGNAFTSEPVHNLVSRLVMQRDGIHFQGRRADDEQQSEFLASSDNWFRPTMIRTGPDGALWIADMYRAVIEHPEWIPAEYQRKMNLYAGNDRGRIYRIVRKDLPSRVGQTSEASADPPRLLSNAESQTNGQQHHAERDEYIREFSAPWNMTPIDDVVARIGSANGWWRDTAQRILQHRRDDAIADPKTRKQLATLAASSTNKAVRVQALATLTMLFDNAASAIVDQGLTDSEPEVRAAAIVLSENRLRQSEPGLIARIAPLAEDADSAVRIQLLLSLGEAGEDSAAELIGRIIQRNFDHPDLRNAGLSSLTAENISAVLKASFGDQTEELNDGLLSALLAQAAAFGRSDQLSEPLGVLIASIHPDSTEQRIAILAKSLDDIARGEVRKSLIGSPRILTGLKSARAIAVRQASDPDAATSQRTSALKLAGAITAFDSTLATDFAEFLSPRNPTVLQLEAVRQIGRSNDNAAINQLLTDWATFPPLVRAEILSLLMRRDSTARILLDAVESGAIAATDLDAPQRDNLLSMRDREIAARAARLMNTEVVSSRQEVVNSYRDQLTLLQGDATAGRIHFEKRCSTCHRLLELGKEIGPDLAALKDRSTEALLIAVLDPNRAVESKYLSYTVVTSDGLQHAGMLKSETGGSLTLIGNDGKELTVTRSEIDQLIASRRSLMPEGLEKDVTAQELADVLAFVQSAGTPWKRFDGNSPQFVAANADGTVTLPASAAEVYGPTLVFEQRYGNLGYWSSTEDYARWTFEVPRSGHWNVEFDFACEDSTAGNLIRLSTGNRMLTARIPGTGTWDNYQTWRAGTIDLHRGRGQLIVTAPDKPPFALVDLRAIRLIPPE